MNNPIAKRNIMTMVKYQLMTAKNEGRLIPFVLILNLIISIVVTQISTEEVSAGSIDFVIISFAVFLAPAMFMYSFRLALLNGVSRKTTMIATLISFSILSMSLAVITVIFMYLANALGNTFDISQMVFNNSPIELLPWLFAVLLFIGVFITFMIVFFTQTRKKVRILTMALSLVLPALLILLNILLNGVISDFLSSISRLLLGVSGGTTNAFLSTISFLTLSIIFSIGIYFFGRRFTMTKK